MEDGHLDVRVFGGCVVGVVMVVVVELAISVLGRVSPAVARVSPAATSAAIVLLSGGGTEQLDKAPPPTGSMSPGAPGLLGAFGDWGHVGADSRLEPGTTCCCRVCSPAPWGIVSAVVFPLSASRLKLVSPLLLLSGGDRLGAVEEDTA